MKFLNQYIQEALVNHKVKNIGDYELYHCIHNNRYYIKIDSEHQFDELIKDTTLYTIENIEGIKKIIKRNKVNNHQYIYLGTRKMNNTPIILFIQPDAGRIGEKSFKYIKNINKEDFNPEYFKELETNNGRN